MDLNVLFLGIFVSFIGIIFLRHGRKNADGPAMLVGIILMVYPYFITSLGWSLIVAVTVPSLYFLFRRLT